MADALDVVSVVYTSGVGVVVMRTSANALAVGFELVLIGAGGVDVVVLGRKMKVAVVWRVQGNRGEMAGISVEGLKSIAQ